MCREQRSKTYAITQALDRYLLKSDAVCGSFGYMPLRRPRYAIGIECSTTMTNLKYFFVNHVMIERYIFSIVSLFQFFFLLITILILMNHLLTLMLWFFFDLRVSLLLLVIAPCIH